MRGSLRALQVAVLLGLFGPVVGAVWAQRVADLDPHLRAEPGGVTDSLRLSWNESSDSTGYIVRRRTGPGAPWTTVAQLPVSATSWDDADARWGQTFEYHLLKTTAAGASGQSWVRAGAEVPFEAADARGVAAIVVDAQTSEAEGMPERLARLAEDLRGDGWAVEQLVVGDAESDTPPEVKAKLWALHAETGGRLRAVLLLGAVPRPFSGKISPDGHPDHLGAWPADGYYADPSVWTDSVNLGGAGAFANLSGDGKFDPSTYPGKLELRVGRVDAQDMSELAPLAPAALVARYLDANHAYRHGHSRFARRAYVRDTFGHFDGEAFSRLAYRDGTAVLGAPAIEVEDPQRGFFDVLEEEEGFALAFGCGGGTSTSASGVASTADFVYRKPRAAFLGLFGSYFGDWSYPDNLLRAVLLSPGEVLATAWFARPYLHLHGLGALQSFGDAFVDSANNSGSDYDVGFSPRSVHQALLGDPTLRLFVIPPPQALALEVVEGGMQLRWEAPAEGDPLDGPVRYHVFRRGLSDAFANEDEVRLTTSPIDARTFTDTTAPPGVPFAWRVVAVQRIQTGSGTFFQHSQGALAEGSRPSSTVPDAGHLPEPDPSTDAGDPPVDPGQEEPPGEGCACASSSSGSTSLPLFVVMLGGWLVIARRRRAATARARCAVRA